MTLWCSQAWTLGFLLKLKIIVLGAIGPGGIIPESTKGLSLPRIYTVFCRENPTYILTERNDEGSTSHHFLMPQGLDPLHPTPVMGMAQLYVWFLLLSYVYTGLETIQASANTVCVSQRVESKVWTSSELASTKLININLIDSFQSKTNFCIVIYLLSLSEN